MLVDGAKLRFTSQNLVEDGAWHLGSLQDVGEELRLGLKQQDD